MTCESVTHAVSMATWKNIDAIFFQQFIVLVGVPGSVKRLT